MADSVDILKKLAQQVRNATQEGENTAERVGRVLVGILENLSQYDIDKLSEYFLRKDQPDGTSFLLKLLGGAEFGVFASGISGANIDAQGAAELLSLLLRSALTIGEYKKGLKGAKIDEEGVADLLSILVRSGIESANFSTGALGAGFCLKKDQNGDSYLEVDRMLVRKVATFIQLLIQQIKHVGGQIILTPASMSCVKVEDMGDYYRCYFENTDGEKTIEQEFVVGDLARAQTFNVKEGVNENVTNTYYWRAVVGVGDNYIDLSKTDCDAGSTEPKAGDDIVQLGNKSDATRQAAIILSAYGNDAPYFKLYRGINSYSLDGKEFVSFSRSEVMIIADTIKFSSGESLKDYIDGAVGDVNSKVDKAISDLSENISFVNQLSKDLESVKNQVDGAIETWFYDPVPTLSNEPAVNWTTDGDKNVHLGDLYYDGNGKAYRFQMNGSTYVWQVITDSDITKALADAKAAQDTADGKRRVFVTTPTNASEYDVGDLWVNATYGKYVNDLLRCKTAKKANSLFSIDHWELASKYTDDAKANQAIEDAANAKAAADNAQADADEAKERLDGWASDGVISPTEKQSLKDEITRIDADKTQIANGYTKYLLGTPTAYNNAYTAYRAVLVTLTASSPETITIPSDFATKQTAYYTQRTNALTAISNAARDYAETISNDLTSYKKTVSSQFEQTNNSITAAVTSSKEYTDSAVGGIQIGGRNYIKKSKYFEDLSTLRCSVERSSTADNSVPSGVVVSLKISKIESSDSRGFYTGLYKIFNQGDKLASRVFVKASRNIVFDRIGYEKGYKGNVSITTEWQDITNVFTCSAHPNNAFIFYSSELEVDDIIYIHSLKIEEGTKPTDWSPAPEDTENALTEYKKEVTAQFSVMEGEINSKVSSTEITTLKTEILNTAASDATNKANKAKQDAITTAGQNADKKYATITTVSSMQTSITQLSSSLSLKAEKSEVTAVQNNLNQTNNNLSALTTRVSKAEVALEPDNIWIGISSRVTTTGKINSIVPDSCFDDANYSLLYDGGQRISSSSAPSGCPTSYCMKYVNLIAVYSKGGVNVTYGEKYYISALVNASQANYEVKVGLMIKTTTGTYSYLLIDGVPAKTTGWKTISGYVTIPSNAVTAYIYFTINGSSNRGTAYYTKVYAYKVDESVNQNYALLTSSENKLTTFSNIASQWWNTYYLEDLGTADCVCTLSFNYEASNLVFNNTETNVAQITAYVGTSSISKQCSFALKANGTGEFISEPFAIPRSESNQVRFKLSYISSVLQSNKPIGYFRVWNLKVEKGERATPWSAAPSDYSTTEEIKSGIEISKNEVSIFGKKISLSGMITFSSCDSDLQSTINSKADSSDITASKDDIAKKLGYSSYADMVNKASAGNTIINGGYIRTSLIDADTLVVKTLNAANSDAINTIVDKEGMRISQNNNLLLSIFLRNSGGNTYGDINMFSYDEGTTNKSQAIAITPTGGIELVSYKSSDEYDEQTKFSLGELSMIDKNRAGIMINKTGITLNYTVGTNTTTRYTVSYAKCIYSAYISSSGSVINKIGTNIPNSSGNPITFSATKTNTGTYKITHNIGDTSYKVQITPIRGSYFPIICVKERTSTYFSYGCAHYVNGGFSDADCAAFVNVYYESPKLGTF